MSTLVHTLGQVGSVRWPRIDPVTRRGAVVAALVAVVGAVPGGVELALGALSEAWLAVSVFVAGTLALVYGAEKALKTDLGAWLARYQRWQVPAGALLGAFPGCGGAIVAVTQYSRGYLSFGGVVATLTATMGDAMFLLLAREPGTALGVLAIGVVVGVASGYVIDALHGPDFMRPARPAAAPSAGGARPWAPARWKPADLAWLALAVPGLVVGVLAAFQVEVDAVLAAWFPALAGIEPAFWLGVAGAMVAVALWVKRGSNQGERGCEGGVCPTAQEPVASTVIEDTNFISTWVVFAFVGYELLVGALGVEVGSTLAVYAPLVPAMAILVGFIPGCGPQIVVTSLYLAGSVPFSAQLGNAIANDGDALFPAIAVAPKAALVATVYSAIPAFVAAYGWYWLVE